MVQSEPVGVEEHPPRSDVRSTLPHDGRHAVPVVTDDRVADRRQVDADLVGPARLEREGDERGRMGASVAPQHRVLRPSLAALGRDGHTGRRASGPTDRGVDHTAVLTELTEDERDVATLDRPIGQLPGQRAVGQRGARHHEEAGRPPIEAMDDARPVRFAQPGIDQRLEVRIPGEQATGEGPPVTPGAGVDDETRRFVHHDEVGVCVDHRHGHVGFGAQRPLTLRRQVDRQLTAGDQRCAPCEDRFAVHPHPAVVHKLRGHRPGHAGEQRHRPVGAHPVQQRGHLQHHVVRRGGRVHVSPLGERAGDVLRQSSTTNTTTPAVMQVSATLNVGQCVSVTKSTTAP